MRYANEVVSVILEKLSANCALTWFSYGNDCTLPPISLPSKLHGVKLDTGLLVALLLLTKAGQVLTHAARCYH